MTDLKTTAEPTRTPVDGSEFVRLATTGANWKASLSSIVSTLAKPWLPGLVYIEDFGGKADWNGSTGTDNLAPLLAAIASFSFTPQFESPVRPTIVFGVGAYYFSALIQIFDCVKIQGTAPWGSEGTTWIFPDNTPGIQFENSNTSLNTTRTPDGRSAQNSVLQGISMRWLPGTTSGTSAHGIRLRTKAFIRDVALWNVGGNGIHIVATSGSGGNTEGNCNDWSIQNYYINGCNGHGLYVDGNDANAGVCIGMQTHGLGPQGFWGGCGIRDSAGQGSNSYLGPQITGYGNTGVFNGGNQYILIADSTGDTLGGATTPGTNDRIWYNLGAGSATASYPQWVSGHTYKLTRPVWCSGAPTQFFGLYAEGGGLSHIIGEAVAYTGQAGFTRYSCAVGGRNVNQSPLQCNTGLGTFVGFSSGQTGFTNNGSSTQVLVGTPSDASATFNNGLNIFEHQRVADAAVSFQYGYNTAVGPDIYYRWASTGDNIWTVTTQTTTQQFGRSAIQPNKLQLYDPVLTSTISGTDARMVGMRSASPATGAESSFPHARGEFYFNVAPTVDVNNLILLGWSCTAGGTPGTFTTVYVKTTSP